MSYTVSNVPLILKPFFWVYAYLIAALLYGLFLVFHATVRIEFRNREAFNAGKNHIFSLWHENLIGHFVVFTRYDRDFVWLNHPVWFMKPIHLILFWMGTKKLALNSGELKIDGKPLPMQYQSSLGTVDLIVAYGLKFKRMSFVAASQQPLTGANRNAFLSSEWNTEQASGYPPGRSLNRKGDALLRAGYKVIARDKLSWELAVLGIYHLGKDTYDDPVVSEQPIAIDGSEGLTVNIASAISYKISTHVSVGLSGGFPEAVREVRPDGLTRSMTITPELHVHF